MSKAFTRESDDSGAEEILAVRPQLPPGSSNYITRKGADRLRLRLNDLLERRRTSANTSTEPDAAQKADQRRIESAIRNVQSILDSITVAEIPADQEKVAIGASVVVRHESGEEEAYQIVGVDEADPAQGRISWISPLARALLSRKAGDKVSFRSPAGVEELTLLTVRYGGH